MNKSIRVLNFDDSIPKQKQLMSQYNPLVIDLKELGPKVRFWMSARHRRELERIINNLPKGCPVTFLGSGDFHHISSLLINTFNRPLSVIVFDFHPDWDTLPPHFSCGSWVNQALKNENIKKCVLLGVSSDDISSLWIEGANFYLLKDNRTEIYPYGHKPSKVFFRRVPQNLSFTLKKHTFFKEIHWDELKRNNLRDFIGLVLKRIPTKDVYISIDKDCLKKEYALTNWEEGSLSLEELLLMLELIKKDLNIVGVDITGDYSAISIESSLKKLCSYFDHPKKAPADKLPEKAVTAINEGTNLKILQLLTR